MSRKLPTPTIRFRVDFSGHSSIGIGKVELLEGIASAGSLSEAARRMHMSYRRAWLLLADMNASFDQPVVHASTGGAGGGGAVLTAFGERVIASYRAMEAGLRPLALVHFRNIARAVKQRPAAAGKVKSGPAKHRFAGSLRIARKT